MKYFQNDQNVSKTLKRTNAIGKIAPVDLLDMGLPQIFNLLKQTKYPPRKPTIPTQHEEVTYNKMRYACICKLGACVENETPRKQGGFLSTKALV